MAPTGNLPRVNGTTVEEWGRIITLLREHDAQPGILDRLRMAAGSKRKPASSDASLIDNHCTRANLTTLLQLGVVSLVTVADFAQAFKLSSKVLKYFEQALTHYHDQPLPNAIIVSDVLVAHSGWSPDTIAVLKGWIADSYMFEMYKTNGLSLELMQQLVDRRLIEGTAENPFFHTPGMPLITTGEIPLLQNYGYSRT